MPYIKQEPRMSLAPHIQLLVEQMRLEANEDDGAMAGILNYTCTKLALGCYPKRRYYTLAMVTGVFINIAQEYYRRWAAPYEDEKLAENGDVYPAQLRVTGGSDQIEGAAGKVQGA